MKKSILRATYLAVTAAIIAVGCGDEGVQNKNPEVGEFINMIVGGGGDNGGGEKRYSLSVGVSPIGSGSVSRSPDSASYKAGSKVSVTASAASGYKFTGWSGASGDVTATVTVTMNSDVSMTANFISTAVATYTLTVNATPSGGGNVSRRPNKTLYTAGEEVTVTAEPADGYTFAGWTGAVNKSDKSVTVTMNSDMTLNANFQQHTYTLSVNANPPPGGTISRDPQKTAYNYGEQVTVTAAPATGYAFDGYSGAVNSTSAGVTITMDGNKTLTANFIEQTASSYTLSTAANQSLGTVTRNPDKPSYAHGEIVTVTAAPASGCTFTGWSGAATGTTNPVTIVMDDDKTLKAAFQQVAYAIIWNADGGTPAPSQTSVNHGGSINQPATTMTKTGHTFDGWYTNSGLTTPAAFPITNVTAVTTLYAKWTVNSYTVTWSTNGGSPAPTQTSVNHGGSITQPAAMTNTGYTFGGWYTNSNLTAAASFPITNVTANTTLYAKWTANATTTTYTITWNADGGTPVPTQTSVSSGGSITQPAAMTKTGYTFGGWYSTSALTTQVTFPMTNITANTTLYAKWTINSYNVTWYADGGTPAPTQTSVGSGGSITQPAAMTKTGYTFDGWYRDETKTTKATFPITNVTANMTLYAKWTINSYNVTWYADGGTPAPTQTSVSHGGNITVPATMTKTGYTFGGWYTNSGLTTAAAFPITNVTGNTTLYAKWTLITYTVTFNANGGTVSTASGTTGAGGKLASLPTPTQSGYTFKGWYTAETEGTQVTTSTVFDANTTIYAQWTLNTYTVTFNPNNGTVSPTSGTTGVGGTLASLPTPTRSDYTFKGWYTATTGGTEVTLDKVYTANTTIYAQWTLVYAVTVISAGTGATGTGSYAAGATVSITAGAVPSGQRFKNWMTSVDVTFANAKNATTSFTMPGKAVTVTAYFIGSDIQLGALTDNRDGKTYSTVDIGGKTWMAENLNYETSSGSWCYGSSADSCAKYGRLYTWNAAMTVCPWGWHLPTRQEWGDLAIAAGGTGTYGASGMAGRALKSTSGWNSNGNGTDEFGFSALPGGFRRTSGCYYAGDYGYWWTATEVSSSNTYNGRGIAYDYDGVYENDDLMDFGGSVRCVED